MDQPPCPSKRKSTMFPKHSCITIHRQIEIKKLLRWMDSFSVHTTSSLHSEFCTIILWYECTRITRMHYPLQIILHQLPPQGNYGAKKYGQETREWGNRQPLSSTWRPHGSQEVPQMAQCPHPQLLGRARECALQYPPMYKRPSAGVRARVPTPTWETMRTLKYHFSKQYHIIYYMSLW